MATKKIPRKPNVKSVRARVEKYKQWLIAAEVRPYLQHLIDAAQAKTKYEVWLCAGMGAISLYCEAPWQQGDWDTVDHAYYEKECSNALLKARGGQRAERVLRLRKRFPELVEFYAVVVELQDDLFCEDVRPRVKPRADDGTQDPADYVQNGLEVRCDGAGCAYVSVEDDFILKGKQLLCEDCANGRGPWKGAT